jgi:hypothetical protein
MIRPGDILTPDFFETIRRELDRRSRFWNGASVRSSNLSTGTLLRAQIGATTAQPVIIARIEGLQQSPFNSPLLSFDFVEVVFDDVRQDYVAKSGGRRTAVFGGNEKAAFELNSENTQPTTVTPGSNPINQVVALQNIPINNTPSAFWWFDERQIVQLDRNVIILERGQGGDCGWVGAPDSNVGNSACSPVGYRYGSPYGQAPGLFTPFFINGIGPNPCLTLGALLGGCTTPNDGAHGDAVQYQTCCPDPLPETIHLMIPSGETSGSGNDTLSPGTYTLSFVLADAAWEVSLTNAVQPPNAATPVHFNNCQLLPQAGAFLTGVASLAFVSCNPPLFVFKWSGSNGLQTLSISL